MANVTFANRATSYLESDLEETRALIRLPLSDESKFPIDTLGSGWSEGNWFYLTVTHPTTGEYEIVRVGHVYNRNATSVGLSIRRAQDGTTQKAFPAGSPVELRLSAGALHDISYTPLYSKLLSYTTPGTSESAIRIPITRPGFYRLSLVGGGGAGGNMQSNGNAGGATLVTIYDLDDTVVSAFSATGGAAGQGSSPHILTPTSFSQFYSGAGGGAAGRAVDEIVYLSPGMKWVYTIGKGGDIGAIAATPSSTSARRVGTRGLGGRGCDPGSDGVEVPLLNPSNLTADYPIFRGSGGRGATNGTVYGYGGAGAPGYLPATYTDPSGTVIDTVVGSYNGANSAASSDAVFGGTEMITGTPGGDGLIELYYVAALRAKNT